MARPRKSAVVAPTVPQISQAEIASYEDIRAKAKSLNDQAKALQKVIDAQETALMSKLGSGATVEAGAYIAMLTQAPGRVSVSWKSEAIKLAEASGQNAGIYEATVKAMNPPGLVTSLLVTKVA